MSETKFVEGIRAYKPNEKAPEFIKANLTVKKADLLTWLKNQPDEFRLALKESKEGGNYYLQVDDYKPSTTSNGTFPYNKR